MTHSIPSTNNPYDIFWTKKVLKNHYDIQLDIQNDDNGPKWKIRKIKNIKKRLNRSPGSANNIEENGDDQMSNVLRQKKAKNDNIKAKNEMFLDLNILTKHMDSNILLKWPFSIDNRAKDKRQEIDALVIYYLLKY